MLVSNNGPRQIVSFVVIADMLESNKTYVEKVIYPGLSSHPNHEIAKKQQADQVHTKDRLDKLENDMSEIKSLLRDIAEMRKA